MVTQNTQAVILTGGSASGAVAQFIAIKQLVDMKVSVKPLGSFSSPIFKGLNEWTTLASLITGGLATGYTIYKMETGQPLSDMDLALGAYGMTGVTAGIVNTFLDPLFPTGVSVNLNKFFKNVKKDISGAVNDAKSVASGIGKFVG